MGLGVGTKTAINQLPSLPQVLVKILDAIQSDDADYQRIADIMRHDTAITAKLLTVANSSYYGRTGRCDSIERTLLYLGIDAVKTIVITISIKQLFANFNQQHSQFMQSFWRRSLITANFAKVLATLTSYSAPEEAYLCGLLTDVGQLILLSDEQQHYLELYTQCHDDQQLLAAEQLQGLNHCLLGAELIDSWNIPGFMADAVRYHHEAEHLLLDAHHLVKIIHLASTLSINGTISDQALSSANTLFGLNEALTKELRNRINVDADQLAQSMGIDIDDTETAQQQHHEARLQLGQRLGDFTELAHINTDLRLAKTQAGLQEAAQRALFLTLGVSNSVLFLLDQEHKLLYSQPPIAPHEQAPALDFRLPLEPGRSLICDALLLNLQQSSHKISEPLSIIDRQILRYCQSDILICWPLRLTAASNDGSDQDIGVLAFATTEQQLEQLELRAALSSSLCRHIASAIASFQQRFDAIEQQQSSAELYQKTINEAVHEASNPLSIMRNYLEMLRIKLGDNHSANDGLKLISEEIDRVGNILLRLKDPQQTATDPSSLHANEIIEGIAHIFSGSICATRQITLELKLDPQLHEIKGNPEHLKQILTNLLKNACEILPPNSRIVVSSEASVSVSGRDFISIYVEDNGPGIPKDIKQSLFNPVKSTKGNNHSGLGLSIVKNLVEDMDGSVVCRSSNQGTQFQILLPQ